MKINQIKTKKELNEWAKKKKKQLDNKLILYINNYHLELTKIEEKINEKLKKFEG